MASVNLGRVGIVLRGDWSATTNYVPLDVVTYNGNSFAAKAASINTLPTNTTYWQPLAQNSEYIAQMEEYLAQAQEYAETAEESSEAAAKALANQADVYSNQSTYSAGDYVLYEGVLYRCLNPITAPENWTPANWETIKVGGALPPLQNDTNNLKNDIGTPFSTTADYSSGDFVMYNGILYRFTESHPAGAWTGEDVSQVSIAGDFLPRNAINIDNHTLSIDTEEPIGAENSYLDKVKFNDSEYDIRDSSAAPAIVETATGSPATISDGADSVPVKSLIAQINPVQAGSGDPSPENIRAITGWMGCNIMVSGKNLLGGIAFANAVKATMPSAEIDTNEKTITFYGRTDGTGNKSILRGNVFKPNTQYTAIINGSGAKNNYRWIYTDGTSDSSGAVPSFGTPYVSAAGKSVAYFGKFNNSATATVIKYDESGIFEGEITAAEYEAWKGQALKIAFPAEAGTVYGGTLDMVNGMLMVTHGYIASYDGETLPGEWISDRDVYAEGTTPTTGAQVVYALAEPITYQLPPTEISTLLGINNIWADTGDVSVEYRADTKTYIDNRISSMLENIFTYNGTGIVYNG